MTKLQKLETEEKRRVRGATPEEELKTKQLSDKAHFGECYKAIVSLQARILLTGDKAWRGVAFGPWFGILANFRLREVVLPRSKAVPLQALPLPAFRAFAEKLERMPDIGKAVALSDRLFHFLDRTRVHHQSHSAALGANQVIVVLLRVQQLEVTT